MASILRRFEISERQSVELVAAGSAADTLVSLAAVAAAIIGISGHMPVAAAACAALAVGVGLLFEGGAVGARFLRSLRSDEEDSLTRGDVLGGITADLVAGIAGMALAVLALFGVAPLPLVGTAVLVYAAALLFGSGALAHASTSVREGIALPAAGVDLVFLAAGGQIVVGLVTLTLGSLALLGAATLPLILAALLLIALSELASGVAVGSKMLATLSR